MKDLIHQIYCNLVQGDGHPDHIRDFLTSDLADTGDFGSWVLFNRCMNTPGTGLSAATTYRPGDDCAFIFLMKGYRSLPSLEATRGFHQPRPPQRLCVPPEEAGNHRLSWLDTLPF